MQKFAFENISFSIWKAMYSKVVLDMEPISSEDNQLDYNSDKNSLTLYSLKELNQFKAKIGDLIANIKEQLYD